MPTHLLIKETIIEPDQDITDMEKIVEQISWYCEMALPTSLHIVVIACPRYALPEKAGVVFGTLPALLVEKTNAGPAFLAHTTSEKHLNYMPLGWQHKKFKLGFNTEFSEPWLKRSCSCRVYGTCATYCFKKAKNYNKARSAHDQNTMHEWYTVEREAKENSITFEERLALRKEVPLAG